MYGTGHASPMVQGPATTGADVVAVTATAATTVQRDTTATTVLALATSMSVYVVHCTSSKIFVNGKIKLVKNSQVKLSKID